VEVKKQIYGSPLTIDQNRTITELDFSAAIESFQPQVFLPAINGAVFALVSHMLMLGGLISCDIFPKFMKPD
jgi:hypothetical protein